MSATLVELVYGELAGRKVLALQGRFHFYEGNPLEVVTFPVRVMKVLGCEGVLVTNAAGGIGFGPGTLMAITDHINMTGQNPLIGENLDDFGPRFPDMSKAYTPEYRETAHKVADKLGIKLDDGVYIGVTGPTYETPAEIRAYKTLGADAVGMSTVPEVIVAAHSGLKVLGISCITNFAAGFQEELNHEEVVEVTERIKGDFKGLLKRFLLSSNPMKVRLQSLPYGLRVTSNHLIIRDRDGSGRNCLSLSIRRGARAGLWSRYVGFTPAISRSWRSP